LKGEEFSNESSDDFDPYGKLLRQLSLCACRRRQRRYFGVTKE
jgi:hypothetical protein